jgi:nicotinamidase-related amidase
MKNYSAENTALLIVDPFNDFLSENGKHGLLRKKPSKALT